ncbi:MAG: indolepyruvate ferredoxin oxidoreductase subunit alpha [Arenicellales bacterium]|nr:indolepyruvate ferredoxin oxidoreductase subunit alpha [Arenicellales bacterium]
MAERSFSKEVQSLRKGEGEVFRGEGVLAVTKALLQSRVSYIGGYQGSPISHMMDVLNDAAEIRRELGVHFENAASEAAAAAMLAASIHYPLRGAVTWKSTVGTNVAADALANVASAGVRGGVLIIVGEDYGEGSSIMQERTHAFAAKSQIWLLDPRPDLPAIVDAVETGFELSEATNTPVMLMLRIRTCHVYGSFVSKDNRPGHYNAHHPLEQAVFDYNKVVLPPSSYQQEQLKITERWPEALRFISENKLNQSLPGDYVDIGIIVQGGIYNALNRALETLDLADAVGNSKIPIYVLTVTYPLIPEEIRTFCIDKKAVLVIEEGQPNYIEQSIKATLHGTDIHTRIHGKDLLPAAGEYKARILLNGVTEFLHHAAPAGINLATMKSAQQQVTQEIPDSQTALGFPVPARPPGFCVGCPERPLFSALKLVQQELGEFHISGDIGCHLFSTLPPFNIGQHTVGYGLGLASSSGLAPNFAKPLISIMGDGGFWHNGLTSGVANAVFNGDNGVLIIIDNGYAAATGHQAIPSTDQARSGRSVQMTIEKAVRGVGARWVRTVPSYNVKQMVTTLTEAITQSPPGLKIIISEGECQLARQRRVKRAHREALDCGARAQRVRLGIDPDVCTGDRACIRLSGCPSLTVKDNPDPLAEGPVTVIDDQCVGCGNCGVIAHQAGLCPSFFEATIINNPSWLERVISHVRRRVIGTLHASEPRGR